MAHLPVIDADAHVIESDETWDHLDEPSRDLRPIVVGPPGAERQYWFIDGRIRGRGGRILSPERLAELTQATGRELRLPAAARDLDDVGARLAHMTELGIDVQVLLPTIFIEQISDRADVELALCRAYNRWLASLWQRGYGRLRWVVVPPILSLDAAIDELRTGKQHGACGVFARGIEGGRLLTDPYFFPLYEEASALDLPIVVHIGNANPSYCDLVSQYNGTGASYSRYKAPLLTAFLSLVTGGIPANFPSLRWGFLEAGAQWLPYLVHELGQRLPRGQATRVLENNRMYVSCEATDDLPHIIKHVGDDNLVIGTDYGHIDPSSELNAMSKLRARRDVDARTIEKILSDNARALYGL
jgi:predicted TIM-barrel fold metal-dependent hydrolase